MVSVVVVVVVFVFFKFQNLKKMETCNQFVCRILVALLCLSAPEMDGFLF